MIKKNVWTPSDEDRLRLADHLVYEVEMMFFLAGRLADTAGTVPDWTPRNAEVEALAVHVRQLIDFFWGGRSKPKDRDAYAADYFEGGRWARVRPGQPEAVDPTLRRRVGWGVAHLTYKRAWSSPQDRQWATIKMAQALAPTVLCFAKRIEDARLGAHAVERIERSAAEFLDRHGPPD